jgi:[acyl-carrier-protein] S-malonyltransferase
MGAPWHDHPAWEIVERAEAVLGEPLAPILLDATDDDLAHTRNAQLAVLLTSLLAWEVARAELPAPVAFAGHSLGQLTALIASGALAFEPGIRLAAQRAAHTQRAADATPGRMAALLGATLDQADDACAAAAGECWVANDNAPGQVVIAGTSAGVDKAIAAARDTGVKRATPLAVGGAFHTPLMHDAARAFASDLATVEFAVPTAPVVCNTDAHLHATGGTAWRDRMAAHLVSTVRWRPSMVALADAGVRRAVEIGPGTTLAALARRCAPNITVHALAVPEDAMLLEEAR